MFNFIHLLENSLDYVDYNNIHYINIIKSNILDKYSKYILNDMNKEVFSYSINDYILNKIYNKNFDNIDNIKIYIKEIINFFKNNDKDEIILYIKNSLIKRILKYDFNNIKFNLEYDFFKSFIETDHSFYKLNKILNDVKISHNLISQYNTIYLNSTINKGKYNILCLTYGIW